VNRVAGFLKKLARDFEFIKQKLPHTGMLAALTWKKS
jgi:hypothetical protein